MARYHFIDVARGIAICGVVIAHHASGMKSISHSEFYSLSEKIIFSVVMPFFFMISAVFLRTRLENAANSNRDILKKISASLLKPFYTLSLLFFFLNLAAPKSFSMPSATDMIKALLYMQSNGAIMPSGVLWFLFTLFTASLIIFISVRFARANIYMLLVLSIALRLFDYRFIGIYHFGIDKLSYFFVYSCIGYALSGSILSGALIKRPISLILFMGYWIAAIAFPLLFPIESSLVYNAITGYSILISTAGCLFLLALSSHITDRFPIATPVRVLRYCGINSMLIYVFHTPVGLIVKQIGFHGAHPNTALMYVLLVVTGIVVPLLSGRLLRYSVPAYNLLLGRTP